MGCDPVIYLNNNFFENDIEYTLNKLSQNSGIKLFAPSQQNKYAIDENCLNIYKDDFNSINECFLKEKRIWIRTKLEEFVLMENSFRIIGDFDLGRWKHFSEFFEINTKNDVWQYYQKCIERIKLFGSLFDSNKMVIFDSYNHQDIEDEIDEGMTIEKVLENKRWRIIQNAGLPDIGNTDFYELYYNEWDPKQYKNIEIWKKEFLL